MIINMWCEYYHKATQVILHSLCHGVSWPYMDKDPLGFYLLLELQGTRTQGRIHIAALDRCAMRIRHTSLTETDFSRVSVSISAISWGDPPSRITNLPRKTPKTHKKTLKCIKFTPPPRYLIPPEPGV